MNIRPLTAVVVTGLVAVLSSGCAQMQSYARSGTNTHFSYPNSNVKPLEPVSFKKKMSGGLFLFTPTFAFTSADEEQILQAAIGQVQDANMLLDYTLTHTHKSYSIPLIPLPILLGYQTSWAEIEGVAAKAEVGEQELK